MAFTVISAFDEFLKNSVNLDSDRTKVARSSRDWLVSQIEKFPDTDSDFPAIYTEKNIFFGSFARNTKIRPLDDIDMMIALKAQGCTYYEEGHNIYISVPESSSQFRKLCHNDSSLLNSKKVINLFIRNLKNISQYERADIKRNQEAATLKLSSYEWNFDVAPCFFTTKDFSGNTYYIIPDGNGNWKKTDPRIDRDRVKSTNQKHNGSVLNAIRVTKYWNKRPTMPSMSSYLIENMIVDYYANSFTEASKYVDIELVSIFSQIKSKVFNPVYDPKGIQGDINNLSLTDRQKIYDRAQLDLTRAQEARHFENEENYEQSIKKWKEIFGNEFPNYE